MRDVYMYSILRKFKYSCLKMKTIRMYKVTYPGTDTFITYTERLVLLCATMNSVLADQ